MENKFGEFVKAKRQEKEISLRKLAEELGIVPAYMSDIEKGRRYPPDKDKIYILSDKFISYGVIMSSFCNSASLR